MDSELIKYEIRRKRDHCRQLMADYKAQDDPETIEYVAKMMAEIRIAEANLAHGHATVEV